ncbi:MAG: helix-turn-helix transcriptional regulator [Oscillospiraceae bacterium]|nr:helix-turn-helix transcriptional regulator [Oscillospiraceae bacterium]
MDKTEFSRRLTELRIQKGVSSRDMSLSIGQSPAYINNIENGVSYPSMASFFYICEYLGVTPKEFFDTDTANPAMALELIDSAKGLNSQQMGHIISLMKELKRH